MDRSTARIFDALLELKDAGLVAASAAAQVDSSAKVLDMGGDTPAGVGMLGADLVVDVSAIEVATGDENYVIILQGSDEDDFSGEIENLAMLELGTSRLGSASDQSDTGRYIVPVTNLISDTKFRYLRLFTVVAGTIATGINYSAFLAKRTATSGPNA